MLRLVARKEGVISCGADAVCRTSVWIPMYGNISLCLPSGEALSLHCTQLTSFQVQSRLFNRLIYREKEEKYFIFIRFLHEYIGNPK